jgi:hypothetical protein
MARQMTLSIEPELAPFFKKESTDKVAFSFGISENTVFSNAIPSEDWLLFQTRLPLLRLLP